MSGCASDRSGKPADAFGLSAEPAIRFRAERLIIDQQ
jgi:hypothetical protein